MSKVGGRLSPQRFLLGVDPDAHGAHLAVYSHHATSIEVCLFEGETETARIPLSERTGDIFYGYLRELSLGRCYGLRAYGPYAPGDGHRFNPAKLLVDPYAVALDRPFRLHPAMLDRPDTRDVDSAPFVPRAIVTACAEPVEACQITPWSRTVIYELHVRGFTKRHPDIPPELRGTFAGLAHPAAIAHLVRLGVTAVEIMPAAAWIEERHLAAAGLDNYWGYNPVAWLAPDPRLAPGGWAEIRAAVAALEAAGIETILDVVLNHSGEGDALGPTLSLRGLDNASYYRLDPGDPQRYVDDTGCGNTLALDRLPVLRLAMDALRQWAGRAGVHGFRFDLATTIGRRPDGFDPAAALIAAIDQDPALRRLKLIAEPWDLGAGGYRLGAFPPAWGEWNDRFRDAARRFWRGDPGIAGELATRLAGSADVFGPHRRPSRSINYITAHDGFTLADLVAYEARRNQANGEQNRDGTADNHSWNNGAEGPTDDPAIRDARAADQRALLATLLLSRGTPMLAAGAEFGQTQSGNNNAYAQDNETSWLDWDGADASLLAFAQSLIALRHTHPAVHDDRFLTGAPGDAGALPDVEWRRADGQLMTQADWSAADLGTLIAVLSTDADRVILGLHRGVGCLAIRLPDGAAAGWRIVSDSSGSARIEGERLIVPARTVVLLALARLEVQT